MPLIDSLQDNPFATGAGRRHSSYTGWRDGAVALFGGDRSRPSATEVRTHQAFRALVLHPKFPCVGAKSALQRGGYRLGCYPALGTPEATAGLAHDLAAFVQERPCFDAEFCTFVATFDGPPIASEKDFEQQLWQQLAQLHALDASCHDWDPAVSSDPDDPAFSFSFAGAGFFIVGMHPGASRIARRFARPALVFNMHAQFEALRASGRFDKMQRVIRDRELALQGSLNPNLADFGSRSEARQYSGRPVEEEWRCPFAPARRSGTG